MGRNPIGSRKMSGKERTQLHRIRKAETEERKQEQVTARRELVAKYGEDRVADTEWTSKTANIALSLLDYFQHKPSKVNDATVNECLDLLRRWVKWYEKDPAMDDDWQKLMRVGFLCKPEDATEYFQNLYRQFQAVNTGEKQ